MSFLVEEICGSSLCHVHLRNEHPACDDLNVKSHCLDVKSIGHPIISVGFRCEDGQATGYLTLGQARALQAKLENSIQKAEAQSNCGIQCQTCESSAKYCLCDKIV